MTPLILDVARSETEAPARAEAPRARAAEGPFSEAFDAAGAPDPEADTRRERGPDGATAEAGDPVTASTIAPHRDQAGRTPGVASSSFDPATVEVEMAPSVVDQGVGVPPGALTEVDETAPSPAPGSEIPDTLVGAPPLTQDASVVDVGTQLANAPATDGAPAPTVVAAPASGSADTPAPTTPVAAPATPSRGAAELANATVPGTPAATLQPPPAMDARAKPGAQAGDPDAATADRRGEAAAMASEGAPKAEGAPRSAPTADASVPVADTAAKPAIDGAAPDGRMIALDGGQSTALTMPSGDGEPIVDGKPSTTTTASTNSPSPTTTPAPSSAAATMDAGAAADAQASTQLADGVMPEEGFELKALRDGGAPFVSGAGEVRSSAPTLGGATPVETGRAVAAQVASAITARVGDQRIELRLDPPELGRVDIELSFEKDALRIVVRAEREDALDLMRRHADDLTRELKAAGLEADELEFASGGASEQRFSDRGGDQHGSDADPGSAAVSAQIAIDAGVASLQSRPSVDGRLDLRV